MSRFSSIVWSSVGKKFLTGITGLVLCVFILEHLSGNLLLLYNDSEPFNRYAHWLHSVGELLIVIELGFVAIFVIHIIMGISVAVRKTEARPRAMRYFKTARAGHPSRKSLSSVSMILTGLVLLVFVIIHLKMFKFGPGVEAAYVDAHLTEVHGEKVRDLYKLVEEEFSNIWTVIGYVAVMLLLGLHLRHGFWSAFQSLGIGYPRYTPFIYSVGIVFAVVMAVGFLLLPILIYFRGVAS
jgi:succinate dehydrogenase / fumarate reductase cytochrome b subunit